MNNFNAPESAALAHLNRDVILCATAERRLFSLISSTKELVGIGQPLPLLFEVIQACAEGDECVIQLHEMAAKLERLASDMASGAFRRTNRKPYGALTRSVPATLQRLHNRAAETDPRVLRKLINRCVCRRLRRFREFSPQTQKVLLHVESFGRRSTGKRGRQAKPMTSATRKKAIDSAMTLLDRLQVSGLEAITRESVDALLNEATRSGKYRTVARMLHCAAPVFRIGHEIGVLPENTLDNIDNDTFKDQARRDFIPPEEVDKIMDLATLDMGNDQQVRDRLVVLLLYDLAVRRSELAGLEITDVERENGRFDILLRPEVQKGSKPE